MFDLCAEPYGFNRMEKESVPDYVRRLLKCDRLYTRQDYAMHEFPPRVMQEINALIKTQEHTYYFSVSSSLRGTRLHSKKRDFFTVPQKTTKHAVGFDLQLNEAIKYQGSSEGAKKLTKIRHKEKLTWTER